MQINVTNISLLQRHACKVYCLLVFFLHFSGHTEPFIDPGPLVKQINSIDGFSIKRVNALIQSKSGFLWLATPDGLLRFDGYSAKHFVHQSDNEHSLAHNMVKDLLEDDEGYIWLITQGGGLSRFNPRTEYFVNFKSTKEDSSTLDSNKLNSISLAQDNKLWIGSQQGVNLFDRKRLTNQRFNGWILTDNSPEDSDVEYENILAIHQDKRQRLWLSVLGKGVFLHVPKTNVTKQFKFDADNPSSLDSNIVITIYESRQGDIWFGTKNGINRFEEKQQQFERFDIPIKKSNQDYGGVNVRSIIEDTDGRIWIGSYQNGVSVLLPDTSHFIELNQGIENPGTINERFHNDILQDSSGALWFATMRNGLVKLNLNGMLFDHRVVGNGERLDIKSLYTDSQGILWLGTSKNLYSYNPSSKHFELVSENIGYITAITEGIDHSLVMNVGDRGVFRFNRTTKQVTAYGASENEIPTLPTNSLHSLCIDNNGKLWVGLFYSDDSVSGLFSFDSQTRQYVQHLDKLTVETILAFEHYIIIGTRRNGLRILDQTTGQWSHVKDGVHDFSHIWSLFLDSQQRIWVGTADSGLAQLDLPTQGLRFRTMGDGLPSNSITTIVEDKSGMLWLGTEKGIVRFQPETGGIRAFNTTHGLQIGDVWPEIGALMSSGEVIMANNTQLVRFSPSKLTSMFNKNSSDHPVLLLDLKLFNRSLPIKSVWVDSPLVTAINETEHLTLSYKDYWFSISFASSNFNDLDNIRYSYKMEGYSQQWIETDANNRVVTFTSLPAGDYILKVKTSHPDGSWNEQYRSLFITITPPLWATTTAYVIYVLSAVWLLYLFNSLRTKRLRQRAIALQNGVEERTIALKKQTEKVAQLLKEKERLFANVSHEFRTPLTLILGPLETQLESVKTDESRALLSLAKANGHRLLCMVDKLLDIATVKSLDNQIKQLVDVVSVGHFLVESYRPLADERNITITLDNQLTDPLYVEMLPDALEKILSNLLTNAFKYTGDHQSVSLSIKHNTLGMVEISVKDTGRGINKSDQKTIFDRFTRLENTSSYVPGAGIGLALVKELVGLHSGTVNVNSQPNIGSTFTVTLPNSSGIAKTKGDTLMVNKTLILSGVEQVKHNQIPERLDFDKEKVDNSQVTILVIEDNSQMRDYVSASIGESFHCVVSKNGIEGVERAQELIPDLIICDVMMPKMNGYEVTRELKNHSQTFHIPVILLTARGDNESRLKGWSARADDFIEKPFNTTALLMRIDNLLAIRNLLRQRHQKYITETTDGDTVFSQASDAPDLTTPEAILKMKEDKTRQQFFALLNNVLERNYKQSAFDVSKFASEMATSKRHLSRKMSSIVDLSPAEAIRSFRLKKAAEKLLMGESPSNITYDVGFTSHSYFSSCFKAKYNCLPCNYMVVHHETLKNKTIDISK